ncbi:MAG: DUF3365 domain-containing protein [Pirellulaceae bacterium]|nr:DUF3365 domain-containing protein [Pirellulaceae bacterium]
MRRCSLWPLAALVFLVPAVAVLTAHSAADEPQPGASRDADEPTSTAGESRRLAVPEARHRAKLLHEVYASTLEMMHERYFHGERAIVPARAMEDVFAQMDRQTGIQARWIAGNTRAMSVTHEPKSDFEKQAVQAFQEGKSEHEQVEDGYLRRAGVIPLSSGCIACHVGFFNERSKTPRFAGLVISVPVQDEQP